MLVLSREVGEAVVIDTGNELVFVQVVGHTRQGACKLGFTAPDHVEIDRLEIAERKRDHPPNV